MWILINRKILSDRYDRMCFQDFQIPICSAALAEAFLRTTECLVGEEACSSSSWVSLSFVGTVFCGGPPIQHILGLLLGLGILRLPGNCGRPTQRIFQIIV
jgi:hypothetical protein